MKLAVEDIFRVTRSGEEDRWRAEGWDNHPSDNRHLLWHGSRTTNFAGILSQGLRIAPPEAPVNGYMFGKGIYLADIVSKSANYCCAYVRTSSTPWVTDYLNLLIHLCSTSPRIILVCCCSVKRSLGIPCSS